MMRMRPILGHGIALRTSIFLRPFPTKVLQYCCIVLVMATASRSAFAHGGAPETGQVAVDPAKPTHLVVRTTYGLISTMDAGKTWQWICETAIGYEGDAAAHVVVSLDGSILATTPLGTKVSHDGGCDWQTPAELKGENDGIDLVRDATDSASVLLLSRSIVGTDPHTPNLLRLFATHDNGKAWQVQGNPVPLIAAPQTLAVAPSRPQRVYVTGVSDDLAAAATLWRSDDNGLAWKPLPVLPPSGGNQATVSKAYIAAVAPQNPDQVYLRVQTSAGNQLWRSDDGGEHWLWIFANSGTLDGFALSPDGAQVAVGGFSGDAGIWVGSTKDLQFQKVNKFSALCLTWTANGLFACTEEDEAGMAVGLSKDGGVTFTSVYTALDLAVMQCPPTTRNGNLCPAKFPMLQVLLGIEDTSPVAVPPPVVAPQPKSGTCAAGRVGVAPQAVWPSVALAVLALLGVRTQLRRSPREQPAIKPTSDGV